MEVIQLLVSPVWYAAVPTGLPAYTCIDVALFLDRSSSVHPRPHILCKDDWQSAEPVTTTTSLALPWADTATYFLDGVGTACAFITLVF